MPIGMNHGILEVSDKLQVFNVQCFQIITERKTRMRLIILRGTWLLNFFLYLLGLLLRLFFETFYLRGLVLVFCLQFPDSLLQILGLIVLCNTMIMTIGMLFKIFKSLHYLLLALDDLSFLCLFKFLSQYSDNVSLKVVNACPQLIEVFVNWEEVSRECAQNLFSLLSHNSTKSLLDIFRHISK